MRPWQFYSKPCNSPFSVFRRRNKIQVNKLYNIFLGKYPNKNIQEYLYDVCNDFCWKHAITTYCILSWIFSIEISIIHNIRSRKLSCNKKKVHSVIYSCVGSPLPSQSASDDWNMSIDLSYMISTWNILFLSSRLTITVRLTLLNFSTLLLT